MTDNFVIFFNAEDRMSAIQNATCCLMDRLEELNNRQPSTIREKIEIINEQIEISKQLRAYENEAANLLVAKIQSMKERVNSLLN